MVLYCYGCSQLSSNPAQTQEQELKCPHCQSEFVQIMDDLPFFPFPGFGGQGTVVEGFGSDHDGDEEEFEEFDGTPSGTASEEDGDAGPQTQEAMQNSLVNDVLNFVRALGTPSGTDQQNVGTIIFDSSMREPNLQQQTQLPSMRDLANFFNLMRSRLSNRSGIDWASLFGIHGDPRDYAMGTEDFDRIMHRLWEQSSTEKGPGSPPLSDEQIAALERVPFQSAAPDKQPEGAQESQPDCSICKEVFQKDDKTIILQCKHRYHEDCIVAWLKISGSCPVCRQQLQ